MIDHLIDKQDNFEIIRDMIAYILASESESQQALAIVDDKDPDPDSWKFRVFTERSNAWEQWLNVSDETDTSPIIDISFDTASAEKASSNVVAEQVFDGTFNIDCYAYGQSSGMMNGHKAGDKEATLELHRIIRLVRNIIMAATYTYLNLRKTVGTRWIQSITIFKPQIGENPVQNITAGRISLSVKYNEFSPQVTPVTLESVYNVIKRSEDGQILIEADYDYTTQ